MAKDQRTKEGRRERIGPERCSEGQREKDSKSRDREQGRMERWVGGRGTVQKPTSISICFLHWEQALAIASHGASVSAHTSICTRVCVCVHVHQQQDAGTAALQCQPSPSGGWAPQTVGMLAAVTACLCREAGRREQGSAVSVSQPVGRPHGGGGPGKHQNMCVPSAPVA